MRQEQLRSEDPGVLRRKRRSREESGNNANLIAFKMLKVSPKPGNHERDSTFSYFFTLLHASELLLLKPELSLYYGASSVTL